VAALGGLLASVANMGGGELTFRLGRRRVLTAIMLASAVSGVLLGFGTGLPYPLLALLCIGYSLLVQADSSGLHMGTVEHADPVNRGGTLAVQSLVGFVAASVSPLAVGLVLDLTGGGKTGLSWAAAFATIGGPVALGPVLLRLRRTSPPSR
jgi:MFS family permease